MEDQEDDPDDEDCQSVFSDVLFTGCYDGDTCTVELRGCDLPDIFRKMPVRVNGIDTPEIKGKCQREKALAIEAKTATWDWVVGKSKGIHLSG